MENKIVVKEDFDAPLTISKRELGIVKAIAEGKSSKEISVDLGVSLKAVESQRYNMLKRLGCPNMFNLIHILHQQNLLS